MKLLGSLFILAFVISSVSLAQSDPDVSIYQGTEKNTSVIVVDWPDGVQEKLIYRNKDAKEYPEGYTKWFNSRYDAYSKRKLKKTPGD